MQGLKVVLLEREPGDRERPGETLHPGIEPLLKQLGIGDDLAAVTGARHTGIWIEWGGARRFEAFGADTDGAWHGFQVNRRQFDALLLARAEALGVTVLHGVSVSAPLLDDGIVCGVATGGGPIPARLVLDASGRSRWLARALDIDNPAYSPPLVARYGYVEGRCPQRDNAPLLIGDAHGWTWTALVRPNTYQWTRVALNGDKLQKDWLPDEFQHMQPLGGAHGADVTWRLATEPAGPGWFLVGDAAALLDPSASHGVLKALMSGIAAAHLAAAVLQGKAPAMEAAHAYRDWLSGWFAADVKQLKSFYRQLRAVGFD